MTKSKNRKAFTLVEILVAAGVTAIFLGMAITLFTGFSKSFSAGEGSAVLMQECSLFTARLRNDLNNAIKTQDSNFITLDETQLMFSIYDSEDGRIRNVIYSAILQKDGYFNISRRLDNNEPHLLIKGRVASYSWHLNEESIPTGATPIKRVGLALELKMGSSDIKNKSFDFKTVIYPVRLNKTL